MNARDLRMTLSVVGIGAFLGLLGGVAYAWVEVLLPALSAFESNPHFVDPRAPAALYLGIGGVLGAGLGVAGAAATVIGVSVIGEPNAAGSRVLVWSGPLIVIGVLLVLLAVGIVVPWWIFALPVLAGASFALILRLVPKDSAAKT